MSRCTMRYLFTVVLYAGVAFVCIPYLAGRTDRALVYVVVGLAVALVAGFARCYFMEGDCTDRLSDTARTLDAAAPRRK